MEYKKLTGTDLVVSCLCLGSAGTGIDYTEQQAFELFDAFVAAGGNFIDTAHVYNDWVPGEIARSERIIGDWLQARGNRSQIILATKGAHPRFESMQVPRMSREEVESDLSDSLRKLKTDYVDIYYLHRDDVSRPVSFIIDMLEDFVRQGKIRYYGCSNWEPARMNEAMEYAKSIGAKGFSVNQPLWNAGILHALPNPDPTLVYYTPQMGEVMKQWGISAVPYSSQAGGYFTKMCQNDPARQKAAHESIYHTPFNEKTAVKMGEQAKALGIPVNSLVLSYLTEQSVVTVPIVGCYTKEQLKDSIAAAQCHADVKWIDEEA